MARAAQSFLQDSIYHALVSQQPRPGTVVLRRLLRGKRGLGPLNAPGRDPRAAAVITARHGLARSLLKKAASPGVFAGFVFDDLG